MAGDDKTLPSAESVVELLNEAECQRLIAATLWQHDQPAIITA